MYVPQLNRDAGAGASAYANTLTKVYRLSSGAVERACGAYMVEDDYDNDPYLIWGSDYSSLKRPGVAIDGRTDLPPMSSNGILKFKLSDIDNLSKVKCLVPLNDVVIYMKEWQGQVLVGCQAGQYVYTNDNFNTYTMFRIPGHTKKITGLTNEGNIHFGEYALIPK